MELSGLILQLEENPGSGASEAVQTPENTRDLPGRGSSMGRLFAPQERVLTGPRNTSSCHPFSKPRGFGEDLAKRNDQKPLALSSDGLILSRHVSSHSFSH